MSDKKPKKEKVTYVDDGRTLADMSGINAGFGKYFRSDDSYSNSTFGDKWRTFWTAFRMMLLPTLVFGAGLCLMFGVAYLLFRFVA